MSIETEFESTITNVKNAYQGLDNLGATIPENKTIENIKSCLDEIYAKFPKTEYAEGTEITLSNTLKGKLDFDNGVVGIGQAEQDSTQGYNLFDAKMESSTADGVTVTNNNDGTFTLNGTATRNTTFRIDQLSKNSQDNLKSYENGDYTLSIGNSKSGLAMSMMQIGTYTSFMYIGSGNSLLSKTLTNATNMFIFLDITSETQFNNFVIKPMLVKGIYTTSTLPSFEKYTGGQASPNPSYPQDIEVVRGRNRWNREYTRAYIDTDGSIVSSTNTLLTDYIDLNDNITISAKNDMFIVGVAYYNSSKTFISREQKTDRNFKNITYSAPSNTNYIRVYVNLAITNFTDEDVENFKIQIEQGTQATPYLPYNTIEEVVSGINIIGLDTNQYKVDLKAGDKITFKNEGTQALTLNLYTNYGDTTRNDFWSVGVNATRIITVAHDTKAIAWEVAPDGLAWGNYGDTLSTYEPYITPTSYQLSLGDIELCGIGDYRDYIYKSGDKWYVHKEIGKQVFTGAESETWYSDITPDYTRYSIRNISDMKQQTSRQECYSNYFKFSNNQYVHHVGDMFAYWTNNGSIYLYPNTDITTTELFKQWLSTHNVEVYYMLETATNTEITDTTLISQLEDIYNMQSLNGTTIITSNGNLPMIIKVRALKGE